MAGELDGIQPEFEILGHLRALGRLRVVLEDVEDVAVGDALLGEGHCPNEAIGQGDELLLDVDGLVVPPHQLRGDLVRMEDGNGATIPDTTGPLDGAAAPGPDPLVQSGQSVEVEAGKVQFPQVPGIVHVPDEDVHVLGGAEAED